MNAVRAVWTNGRILPAEPVDWPEGSELIVEPITPSEKTLGILEAEWRDDPASVAAWEAGVRNIEPPQYSNEERDEMARFREDYRKHNIEAVRRQMDAGDER